MSKRRSGTITPPRPAEAESREAGSQRRAAPESRPPQPGFRRWGWWGAAALGVLLVVAALFGLRGRRPAAPVAAAAPVFPVVVSPVEQSLRETLARLPQEPDAHRALARHLLEQERPFEALWQFRRALDLNPQDAESTRDAARALVQAGLPAQARRLLQTRLSAAGGGGRAEARPGSSFRSTPTPMDLEARLVLAEAALATAQPEAAEAALSGAGAALSASAPGQLLRGDARWALGDRPGARSAYQRATALEPESAAAYDRLGRLALAEGDEEAAKAAFSSAREREPGEPGHGYRLGLAFWNAGDRQAAEQLWAEVAASVPEYAPVRVALGNAYRRRGQLDEAAAHLVSAVNVAPVSREAQYALADVMTAQGDQASAAYQRGFYFLQTDRPHLAVPQFRRIQALAPDRVDGPRMSGMAYIVMQRLDLAAAVAKRGLERHRNNSRLLGQLGLLYVLGRNRPQAKQLCEEWLKVEPGASEPYRLLGRVAREEQRMPESLQYYEQALARNGSDAVICSEMAKTLAALPGPENARRALEMARQAVSLNPREADYWQQWGTLLRAAGRQEEATRAFLRALDLSRNLVASCTALVQIAAQERRGATSRFYAGLVTVLQDRNRTSDAMWRAVFRRPMEPGPHRQLARFLLGTGDLRRASFQLEQVVDLQPGDAESRRALAVVERLLELREK